MSKQPCAPESADQIASRIATRVIESLPGLTGNLPDDSIAHISRREFPSWVKKMATSLRRQILSSTASKAHDAGDFDFTIGYLVGAVIGTCHFARHAPGGKLALSEIIGREMASLVAGKEGSELFAGILSGETFKSAEIKGCVIRIAKTILDQPYDKRSRFFAGLREGSDLEETLDSATGREGLAFFSQLMLLLYWPEVEAMKSRHQVYEFLQFRLRKMPAATRSEETFVQLAKRYGLKSRARRTL